MASEPPPAPANASASPIGEALSPAQSTDGERIIYRAKKRWPPDLLGMDPKHQFRLEQRYRRRAAQSFVHTGWNKGIKMVQITMISGVLAYSVLLFDWGDIGKGTWFERARKKVAIDMKTSPIDMKLGHARIASAIGVRPPTSAQKADEKS